MRFPGGCGHELAGIVDRDDASRRSPVAVFSHCFTCNKDLKAIVRISRGLADSGISVLRFDMTGLGGSGGEFRETNFTTNQADLLAAMRFATTELGKVDVLIGHSFGGAASLAVAAKRAAIDQEPAPELDTLRGVATLAAPSDTQHLADLLVRMSAAIESAGSGQVSIGGRRWTITKQMVDDFRSHRLPDLIAGVDVPTLIFHSPVDETVSYDHAIRIQTLMNTRTDRAPLASLITLPLADHLLIRDPTDLNFIQRSLAAWIDWRSAGSEPSGR